MANKSKVKHYTRKKVISGTEYTAQFNGLSAMLSGIEECYADDGKRVSSEKFTKYILENIIVSPPGLEPDDFDSSEELNEVIKFGRKVMDGTFRDKEPVAQLGVRESDVGSVAAAAK